MANPTFDLHSGAGRAAPAGRLRRGAATERQAAPAALAVLAPGESDAHPPEAPAHWDLGPRVAVVVGLAALSWVAIVAAVVLLLHH